MGNGWIITEDDGLLLVPIFHAFNMQSIEHLSYTYISEPGMWDSDAMRGNLLKTYRRFFVKQKQPYWTASTRCTSTPYAFGATLSFLAHFLIDENATLWNREWTTYWNNVRDSLNEMRMVEVRRFINFHIDLLRLMEIADD